MELNNFSTVQTFVKQIFSPKRQVHAISFSKLFNRDEEQLALDAFARLITGPDDKCSAVCIDHKGMLLIANNSDDYAYAKERIKNLKDVNHFVERSKNLLQSKPPTPNQNPNLGKDISNFIDTVTSNIQYDQYKENLTNFLNTVKNTYPSKQKLVHEILEPINDYFEVQNYLGQNPENKLNQALESEGQKIKFLTKEDLVDPTASQFIKAQAKNMHAEIKIAHYLSKQNNQAPDNYQYNIGLSKLSCASCYALIQAFEKIGKIKFNIPGTHAKMYQYQDMSMVIDDKVQKEATMCLLQRMVFKDFNTKLDNLRNDTLEYPTQFNDACKEVANTFNTILKVKLILSNTLTEDQESVERMKIEQEKLEIKQTLCINNKNISDSTNPRINSALKGNKRFVAKIQREETVLTKDSYDKIHLHEQINRTILEKVVKAIENNQNTINIDEASLVKEIKKIARDTITPNTQHTTASRTPTSLPIMKRSQSSKALSPSQNPFI